MSQLYNESGFVVSRVLRQRGSLKQLVLSQQSRVPESLRRAVFALSAQTLRYAEPIDRILRESGVDDLVKQEIHDYTEGHHYTAMAMCYDVVFGSGRIRGGGALKKALWENKDRLKETAQSLCKSMNVRSPKFLIPEALRTQNKLPRYARVNTILTSMDDVVQYFCQEGYNLTEDIGEVIGSHSPDAKIFCKDIHIPNLLIFSSSVEFHGHPFVQEGKIILQDKASCFSATVLQPRKNSHVIDGCAAPGNKTTHLASLMENKGKVTAFEIDGKRFKTLQTMCNKAGASCIDPVHGSFLEANPRDPKYVDVESILLDPSCSGSGIVHRLESSLTKNSKEQEASRLKSLSDFQKSVIIHAFQFPSVQTVVYSTCSVHDEENERVVQYCLQHEAGRRFRLDDALPGWPRRGKRIIPQGEKCIRTDPSQDQTIGFFVARFVRANPQSDAPSQATKIEKLSPENQSVQGTGRTLQPQQKRTLQTPKYIPIQTAGGKAGSKKGKKSRVKTPIVAVKWT